MRHATTVFATLDALRAELGGARRGAVTIGSTEPAASQRVLAFVRAYERRHPEQELSLRVGTPSEMHALVERGELEIAVTAQRHDLTRRATFTRLYEQDFVLLVPERHRLAAADTVDLEDLRGVRLLVGDDACVYRRVVEQMLLRADVDVALRARLGALTTLPHGVSTGLGVALVPRELVTPPPPQTVVLPLRHPLVIPIGVLMRDDASDAARIVAAALLAHCR